MYSRFVMVEYCSKFAPLSAVTAEEKSARAPVVFDGLPTLRRSLLEVGAGSPVRDTHSQLLTLARLAITIVSFVTNEVST